MVLSAIIFCTNLQEITPLIVLTQGHKEAVHTILSDIFRSHNKIQNYIKTRSQGAVIFENDPGRAPIYVRTSACDTGR